MCGSGTVLRAAAEAGYTAIGFDLDPLAVLMSRVWTTPVNRADVSAEAERVVQDCSRRSSRTSRLDWIDEDPETTKFIQYWFAKPQEHDLRRLAARLIDDNSAVNDVLKLALSRIIVTKERGASLARDVSHSRPHRTALTNDYDVLRGFLRAVAQITRRITPVGDGQADVALGDARDLTTVAKNSIALVVTSPPYLNAIDYLRGHRLALVWLGHRIQDLRAVRAISIGAERRLDGTRGEYLTRLLADVDTDALTPRVHGMLERYAQDLYLVCTEVSRVLRHRGQAVMVLGNSTIRGVYVDNASIAQAAATACGLRVEDRVERALPMAKRYLPPPSGDGTSDLNRRMRSEVVLRFSKP